MKIAIPIFGPRVSPRFDCAPSLLLFTVQDGEVVERREVPLNPLDLWQRLDRLRELGIQALICGAIDGQSAQALQAYQIQVIAWVAGEVEEAMESFLRGELTAGLSICPGFRRRRFRLGRRCMPHGKKNIRR